MTDRAEPGAPIVRSADPASAHLGAARIEPHRGTRKAEVLAALTGAMGAWVDGDRLATQACGGSEGRRRLRELVADGWPIESRPHPHSKTAFQYRLTLP